MISSNVQHCSYDLRAVIMYTVVNRSGYRLLLHYCLFHMCCTCTMYTHEISVYIIHVCVHTIVSLFSTDPTLTHANISTVTATVPLEDDELGGRVLGVPESKCKEIHQQSSTAAEEKERLIHHYLNISPYASWSHLAGGLYCRQNHDALSAVRRFIKTEPGEFMCILVYVCLCIVVQKTVGHTVHEHVSLSHVNAHTVYICLKFFTYQGFIKEKVYLASSL